MPTASTVSTTTTTTSEQDHSYPTKAPNMENDAMTTTTTSTNMLIVGILVGLIAILTVILVILLVRPIMDYVKARLPENKRRKELRYRTIEGWLISKRIRSHDEVCTHSLEHFAKPPPSDNENDDNNNNNNSAVVDQEQEAIKHSLSYDTAETAEQSMELEWKECPICMEEFKVDEIVSWSPDDQTSCLHFFHHECIKEWLLRSPHCPYCRCTIIPVDDCRPAKVDKLTLLEMSKRRARKAATTYCCHEHGLVHLTHKPTTTLTTTPPTSAGTKTNNTNNNNNDSTTQTTPRSRWNTRRDKIMWEAVLQCRVTPAELMAKRGGRNEAALSDSSSSSSADSELASSILIPTGGPATTTTASTTTTTILQPEHVVPPSVLLSEMEAVAAAAVDEDDLEAPPASGNSAPLSEEQASSSVGVDGV